MAMQQLIRPNANLFFPGPQQWASNNNNGLFQRREANVIRNTSLYIASDVKMPLLLNSKIAISPIKAVPNGFMNNFLQNDTEITMIHTKLMCSRVILFLVRDLMLGKCQFDITEDLKVHFCQPHHHAEMSTGDQKMMEAVETMEHLMEPNEPAFYINTLNKLVKLVKQHGSVMDIMLKEYINEPNFFTCLVKNKQWRGMQTNVYKCYYCGYLQSLFSEIEEDTRCMFCEGHLIDKFIDPIEMIIHEEINDNIFDQVFVLAGRLKDMLLMHYGDVYDDAVEDVKNRVDKHDLKIAHHYFRRLTKNLTSVSCALNVKQIDELADNFPGISPVKHMAVGPFNGLIGSEFNCACTILQDGYDNKLAFYQSLSADRLQAKTVLDNHSFITGVDSMMDILITDYTTETLVICGASDVTENALFEMLKQEDYFFTILPNFDVNDQSLIGAYVENDNLYINFTGCTTVFVWPACLYQMSNQL